jgi:hypothetical protein
MEVNLESPKALQSAGKARCLELQSSRLKRLHQLRRTKLCHLDHHLHTAERRILHSVSQSLLHSFQVAGTSPASSTTDSWRRTNYHPANYILP